MRKSNANAQQSCQPNLVLQKKSKRLIDQVFHANVNFLKEESGASFIECALVGSLIAAVAGLFLLVLNKHK